MLYVIAGHGAGDPGACGNGYQEAERVRILAQRIKDIGGDKITLCDFNINAYKSNVIGKKLVPKGSKILELHMDSANPSARGGHVIIKKGFKADDYDKALAALISNMFPGRDKSIVERSDLANVNRAATCGYNYRLLECGFISNTEDVNIFNSRMDELAKGILACFGIKEAPKPQPKPTVAPKPTQSASKKSDAVRDFQNAAICDGFTFPKYGADGEWGAECESVAKKAVVKYRVENGKAVYKYRNLTKIVQRKVGVTVDGKCGKKTDAAIRAFQSKHGLTVDGDCGLDTWRKILGV